MEREVDVAVIGGGISGCAIAYHLAKRGTKVALFEKGEIAGEASSRNWGYVRQGGRHLTELPLMSLSLRLWAELNRELNGELGFVQAGQLVPIESAEDLAVFEQRIKIGRDHGLSSRLISAKELSQFVPGLGGPWIGAVYSPHDGLAEPRQATNALAAAARRAGAAIYTNCAVEALGTVNGRVRAVATEQGDFSAAIVVCAAGIWSPRLLRTVGFDLPTRVVRSTVAATQPCPAITKIGVWGPYVAFRQTARGSFYLGNGYRTLGYAGPTYRQSGRAGLGGPGPAADYDVTLDSFRNLRLWLAPYLKNRRSLTVHVGPALLEDLVQAARHLRSKKQPFSHLRSVEPKANPSHVRYRLKHFYEMLPALSGTSIERAWAGYIDTSPDSLAVIGELDQPKGLIVVGPFCGHGFAMGPVTGHLVSELILDGKPSLDIQALRPTRFKEGRVEPDVRIL